MDKNLVPIFILNLDTSPERFEAITKELNELNLEGIRISGVDGSKLSEQERKIYSPELNHKFFRHDLSSGEIGCMFILFSYFSYDIVMQFLPMHTTGDALS